MEGRNLLPELLDRQAPEATQSFVAEDGLHFEYHYPTLPEGLSARFLDFAPIHYDVFRAQRPWEMAILPGDA